MDGKRGRALSTKEIEAFFSDPNQGRQYPPILNYQQASLLLQVPVETLRNWRSRGLLDDCSFKVGKHVRIIRDRLVHRVFNEGLTNDEDRRRKPR